MPSRPSKDRVISRRRKRGNVRFRMRDGRGERVSRNNGVNGMCTYVNVVQRGARIVATRRVAADGWTAALREITSHARNDRETVTLLSPCLPDYSSSFPATILPPLSLRGIRVSRCPSCPLVDVGQPPVSPPYPASDRSPSPRVHASGRPTITFREYRREMDTTSKDSVCFVASTRSYMYVCRINKFLIRYIFLLFLNRCFFLGKNISKPLFITSFHSLKSYLVL